MSRISVLDDTVRTLLGDAVLNATVDLGELTVEVAPENVVSACRSLRDNDDTAFDILIDLCGVDYSGYGEGGGQPWKGSRYAVVYHLLSIEHNQRIRVKVQLDDHSPVVDSVMDVWSAADWFEREAFDLYGIIFNGHPDLRRLLTDYGFIGHPFRKDFPLSGKVEMHYDEEHGRVMYKPVTVEDRILVPRTIRKDTFTGTRRQDILAEESE